MRQILRNIRHDHAPTPGAGLRELRDVLQAASRMDWRTRWSAWRLSLPGSFGKKLCPRPNAKFLVDMSEVHLHRALGHEETICDVFV
jgi:hypothetical protein